MKEEDKIKKFIADNKEDFDEDFSSEYVWGRISNTLDASASAPAKRFYLNPAFKVAASVIILFTVALVAFYTGKNNTEIVKSAEQEPLPVVGLSAVSQEMAEVEKYYTTQIQERLDESKSLNISPDNFSDLELLKTEYEDLKKEMGTCPDKEVIIQAMIENYRLRLEILNTILEEIKKQKENSKGNNDEA